MKREIRRYVWANGLSGFTVDGGIYAVVLNLYLLRLGFGTAFIGTVNGAGLLSYGLSSLAAGWLGSRFRTHKMIVLGLLLMAAGAAALPVVEFVPPGLRALWIVASFVVANAGLATHVTSCTPFVSEISRVDERHRSFSIVATVWSLSGFAGNVVGGLLPVLFSFLLSASLSEAAPYGYSLSVAPALLLGAAAMMARARAPQMSPMSESPEESVATAGKDLSIVTLALIRFLFVLGCGSVLIFLNVYLDTGLGAGAASIGLLLGAGRLSAAVMSWFAPRMAARWSKPSVIVATVLGTVLSMIPLILISTTNAAAASFIGVMTLLAIRVPTWLAYSMEAVSPRRRAMMSGAGEMANGLGFAVVGLGGGYVADAMGYRFLFLSCACLTLVGTYLFCRLLRTRRPGISRSAVPASRMSQPA